MTSEESGVEIRGTVLLLDGEPLSAEQHSVSDLAYAFGALGRHAIVNAIETAYDKTRLRTPDSVISRPSLSIMNLGNDQSSVLTSYGTHNRTAVHRSILEIQPEYREHWWTVLSYDLTPEVRSRLGQQPHNSAMLMLRNPETDPAPITPLADLPRALGFLEPAAMSEIKPRLIQALHRDHSEMYRTLYDELVQECHAAVDRQTDSYPDEDIRPAAQIGMIVALANLGVEIEGDEYLYDSSGYMSHLRDAEEYAYQMHMDELSGQLDMEIDRVTQLSAEV